MKEEPIHRITVRRSAALLFAAALIAVAAVLVPAATAGSNSAQNDQGGGAAYALVNPTSGSPQLIAAHTSGFVAVSVGNAGQGDYCLTPAPGVDVVHTAAVASQDATYSNAFGSGTRLGGPSRQSTAPQDSWK
jgi:hypothetical protein